MQGEHGRIWGDDECAQFTFAEGELRNSKSIILIVAGLVGAEIGGFRNAPRDAPVLHVCLLGPYSSTGRALKKCIRVSAHPDQRHQVLEHGTGPRAQYRAPMLQSVRAPQQKPSLLPYVVFRDGDESGDTRFRSQQVVTCGMHLLRLDVEPDRQKLALV